MKAKVKGPLTDKQQEVLNVVKRFIKSNGWPPTRLELGLELGINANAAHEHLRAIQKKGYIKLEQGISRGIKVIYEHPKT